MTQLSLFYKLTNLLFNELNAPEILPFSFDLILFTEEIIKYQKFLMVVQEIMTNCKNTVLVLKKIEINRIRQLVEIYRRVRLWKIEIYIFDSGKKISNIRRLDFFEQIYFKSYISLFKRLLDVCFLEFFPVQLRRIVAHTIKHANTCSVLYENIFVFFHVFKEVKFTKRYSFDPNTKRFQKSQIFCVEYNLIKKLVYAGILLLI